MGNNANNKSLTGEEYDFMFAEPLYNEYFEQF